MLVTADEGQLQIVLHTDLARLTAQLAAWWGNAEFARLTPYVPMVVAAQEHAAGWRTWEMTPYLDLDGRPIDAIRGARYLGPHWIDLCVESVATLAARDAYAAIIASLHWETLLDRVRAAWPPDLEAVMADQRQLREHLIEALWEEGAYRLETDPAHLSLNQAALDALDRIATRLVSQPTAESDGRLVVRAPIGLGLGDADLRLTRSSKGEVLVEPYPFGPAPLRVFCTTRFDPDRAYERQSDFLHPFYRAPLAHATYTLGPPPRSA